LGNIVKSKGERKTLPFFVSDIIGNAVKAWGVFAEFVAAAEGSVVEKYCKDHKKCTALRLAIPFVFPAFFLRPFSALAPMGTAWLRQGAVT